MEVIISVQEFKEGDEKLLDSVISRLKLSWRVFLAKSKKNTINDCEIKVHDYLGEVYVQFSTDEKINGAMPRNHLKGAEEEKSTKGIKPRKEVKGSKTTKPTPRIKEKVGSLRKRT